MNPPPAVFRSRFLRAVALACGLAGGPGAAMGDAPRFDPALAPLKVVFFTDIHARTEWETPDAMQRAAAAINAQQADVVICGGDLITDGYTSSAEQAAPRWEAYLAMHQAIHPEPVVVLGNHDLVGVEPDDGSPPAEDPRAEFRARLNLVRTYQFLTVQGYHFFLLDSVEITDDELKYRGYIDADQMEWLRGELARVDPETPIVLVTHLPLLTGYFQATAGIEAPVPASRGVVNNREVLAAFAQHRLLAVLQGHLHIFETLQWRGTTFVTGGAVSGKWWRGDWHGTPPGFVVIELHPDRVDARYQPYPWIPRRP